ncbi:MAG TPA: efflux transporter outer membrane subunit [Rhizomicrobium sp.]|nr:efflux transporter outer membrane subunit [Rhizomicrobium sp.]
MLGLLSACAVGPDFARPEPPAVTHYTHGVDPAATVPADNVVQHFSAGAEVEAEWWRQFKSPKLDAVIHESLERNQGLEAAQASLHAAQDNLRSGYGVFFPQIGADYGATREKFSPSKFGSPASASLFNLYSLSGTVSYALDIWGGERREVEALGAQKDVEIANERATYLALVSNIANTVIARAAYRAEVDATKALIEEMKQQVALAKTQFRAGTVSYSNVLALETQLETYEASLPGLEQKIVQADDLLASLAGYAPAEWSAPAVTLSEISLPRDLPVSLPSALVGQRPDILAAEATAHGASAQIGVATAAMLPNITLSGSYGGNSNAMNNLLTANGTVWSFGADVAQPIFEGGTLWFKRKAAIDTYKQSAALYRQTVLNAFEQVADTLRALDHDAEALDAQEHALNTAKEALHLAQSNYEAGTANYLDVIVADTQYHQAQINELAAVAARYQDTVALFVALGGSWNTPDATDSEVALTKPQ